MSSPDYVRGLSEGFKLALAVVQGARSIEDAIELLSTMRNLALEGAIERVILKRCSRPSSQVGTMDREFIEVPVDEETWCLIKRYKIDVAEAVREFLARRGFLDDTEAH